MLAFLHVFSWKIIIEYIFIKNLTMEGESVTYTKKGICTKPQNLSSFPTTFSVASFSLVYRWNMWMKGLKMRKIKRWFSCASASLQESDGCSSAGSWITCLVWRKFISRYFLFFFFKHLLPCKVLNLTDEPPMYPSQSVNHYCMYFQGN